MRNVEEISALINRNQYKEAEKKILEKIKNEKNNSEYFYLLGTICYFQGKINLSIQYLKEALKLNKQNTEAAVCLSALYNDIGKYEEARKVFEIANSAIKESKPTEKQKINQRFSIKHLELADLYFRYYRYDEAIEEYQKAIKLDPSKIEIRIRKAKVYAKKGLLHRTIQELKQLKKEYPNYIPIRIQIGLIYYSQNNIIDAELEWESALNIEPFNKEVLKYISMAKDNRIKTSSIITSH